MFSVTVRDHVMIAHSFRGEFFGPAQRLHGATYVVDATFRGPALDVHGVLVDIGAAAQQLRDALAPLDYRNLDDDPEFAARNSTTEVVAQTIAQRLRKAATGGHLGGSPLSEIEVTLHESHIASASFTEIFD